MAKTDRVPRQVIDGKLLAALDEESKVAMFLGEEDLSLLISAATLQTEQSAVSDEERRLKLRLVQLLHDMHQLRREAFGG